jgi:hypothetical protein
VLMTVRNVIGELARRRLEALVPASQREGDQETAALQVMDLPKEHTHQSHMIVG